MAISRAKRRQVPTDPDEAPFTFVALSTRHAGGVLEVLKIDAIEEMARTAEAIDVASAFHDRWFCDRLAALAAAQRPVRLLVNDLGPARRKQQREELGACLDPSSGVVVRLAKEPGLFHAKLILLHGNLGTVALIGSMNATRAAVTQNEELLIRLIDRAGTLAGYFDRIWEGGSPPHEDVGQSLARSLPAFFRAGRLYFKPTRTEQMSLNPFQKLLKELPEADRKRLNNQKIRYAEPGQSITAFNIFRALDVEEPEDDASQAKRAQLSRYGLETSLGYWVPLAYDARLQFSIKGAAEAKAKRYEALLQAMDDHPKTAIRRYKQYLADVRTAFKSARVSVKRRVKDLRVDPFEDVAAFQRFYGRLERRLRSSSHVRRLSWPFIATPVPEFWDDPASSEEFIQSFFDSLEIAASRPGKKPALVKELLGFGERRAKTHGLRRAFEARLHNEGWPVTGVV